MLFVVAALQWIVCGGDGGGFFFFFFFVVVGERERGRIKNNKERIFKWNGKKNKSFDVRSIVKWCVKYYKVRFLLYAKC